MSHCRPRNKMYIYNVWTDDVGVDEWTYSPREAIERREYWVKLLGEDIRVTRYYEDESYNVNWHVRVTDAMLAEDAKHFQDIQ
jgi:hypothetical protein